MPDLSVRGTHVVWKELASLLECKSGAVRPLQEESVNTLIALSRWTPAVPAAGRRSRGRRDATAAPLQLVVEPFNGPAPFPLDVPTSVEKLLRHPALREERDQQLDALVRPLLIVGLGTLDRVKETLASRVIIGDAAERLLNAQTLWKMLHTVVVSTYVFTPFHQSTTLSYLPGVLHQENMQQQVQVGSEFVSVCNGDLPKQLVQNSM